jgi:hypothetical protein
VKKIIIAFILSISGMSLNFAQETQPGGLYTVFLNIVNKPFQFPLIGFVNIAKGNHAMPQIGFLNWNQNNFSTVQAALLNTVGGTMSGAQIGLANTAIGDIGGVQIGLINTVNGDIGGVQMGLINTAAGGISGFQIGLINYVDSIEAGFSIGLLSIVKNGGYKAIEFGVSEMAPFNLSFKIGIEQFYTSFILSINPFGDSSREWILWGVGFGSIVQLNKRLFINPEITSHYAVVTGDRHYLGFIPHIGYNIIPNLSIVIGPSVIWAFCWDKDEGPDRPFYNILHHRINDKNSLYLGARMAFRFRW